MASRPSSADTPDDLQSQSGFAAPSKLRLEMARIQFISKSVRYLLLGSVLGLLGFVVAVLSFILRVIDIKIGNESNSSSEPLPATVSEMVSKWERVEARLFFGFELTASFCILLSWYPFKLRAGSCIPLQGGCTVNVGRCCSISWATIRQFFPPLGLLLVACVPTVNLKAGTGKELVLVVSHCFAALFMFASFLMSEAHVLRFWPFYCKCLIVDPSSKEYCWRWRTFFIALVTFIAFNIVQGVLMVVDEDVAAILRPLSFGSEVVSGLAMLFNHLTIWYYAPERTWAERNLVIQRLSDDETAVREELDEYFGTTGQLQ